jgi:hypothetical protein
MHDFLINLCSSPDLDTGTHAKVVLQPTLLFVLGLARFDSSHTYIFQAAWQQILSLRTGVDLFLVTTAVGVFMTDWQ